MKDSLGSVQSVLVLGGGSDIALATLRLLVADRTRKVILAARAPERLAGVMAELRCAGAQTVEAVAFDADAIDSHDRLIDDIFDRHGDMDMVLIAFGRLGDQASMLENPQEAAGLIHTNFTGSVSVLLAVARRLRAQGHGSLVVLSSVAAERVRRSNFIYGSSKAGLDAFAQGLGDELATSAISLLVVRPGMVHTKMTEGMKSVPFTTTPEKVAAAIVAGVRRNARIVWVPGPLRGVMFLLRHLPAPLFRRLDL